ncbi:O-antigen ligase family protein [Nakamurella sp. GG22]
MTDSGPGWLTWIVCLYGITLILAASRAEGSAALLALIGCLVTGTVLIAGADTGLRGANLAAALLVAGSLLAALVDPRLVVSGSRDLFPVLYEGRVFGLLEHPNGLGQMSAILFMLAWNRRSAVSFVLAATGLLAAVSQTAMVAVALAAVTVMIVRLIRRIKEAYRAPLALFALAVMASLCWLFASNAIYIPNLPLSQEDLTLTNRTYIWEQLSAGGVPTFGLGSEGLAERIAARTIVGSAHNIWLEGWLRDGALGVLGMSLVLIVLLRASLRRPDPSLALGGLVMLLVEGMTESSPAHPIFFPFYAVLAVYGGNVSKRARDPIPAAQTAHFRQAEGRG